MLLALSSSVYACSQGEKKKNSSIQGARVIIDALTVTLPPPGAPRRDAFTITGSVGAASYMLPTFRKLAVM